MTQIDTHLFIRPMEPLFFGTPSPFNAGESHFSRSMFPPSPTTFQGILRSHLLRGAIQPLNLDDWSAKARQERAGLVGESDRLPDGWQIKGPLPAQFTSDGLDPWAPVPRFLFIDKSSGKRVRGRFQSSGLPYMDDLGARMADSGFTGYGSDTKEQFSSAQGWVDADTLWWTLAGRDPDWPVDKKIWDLPPFLKDDQIQPGISLHRRKNTAEDSMLYRLEHLRFSSDSGFWGYFSGSLDRRLGHAPFSAGTGGAGRKGRLVAFESPPVPVDSWAGLLAGRHIQKCEGAHGYFWLYLLSPVAMEPPEKRHAGSFLPGSVRFSIRDLPRQVTFWDANTNEKPGNAYIRCCLAVTGPPVILGGMDMAKGSTRANNAYVPAGSTWLLEIQGDDPRHLKEILLSLNNTHPAGPQEQALFGFGHTLVGIGPEKKE